MPITWSYIYCTPYHLGKLINSSYVSKAQKFIMPLINSIEANGHGGHKNILIWVHLPICPKSRESGTKMSLALKFVVVRKQLLLLVSDFYADNLSYCWTSTALCTSHAKRQQAAQSLPVKLVGNPLLVSSVCLLGSLGKMYFLLLKRNHQTQNKGNEHVLKRMNMC